MADNSDEALTPNELLPSLANDTLNSRRLDLYTVRHTVLDMTPEAATAMVKVEEAKRDAVVAQANATIAQAKATEEIAKFQHEVPAKENSKRHYTSWGGAVLLAGGAILAGAEGWLTPGLASVLIAVAGIFVASDVLKSWIEKKNPPKD